MRVPNLAFQVLLVFLAFTHVSLAERPNIVLFVTDDQSPDIGAMGNPAIQTPNMDALAKDGIVFEQAFCTTASCSASRSVILSGLHNHYNGQYGHQHSYHHFQSFDRVRSLPNRLTESDYETIRIGKYHVAPEEVYQFETVLKGNTRNPVEMANNVGKYFDGSNEKRPFFLYFCTSDPHRGGGTREDIPFSPNAFGNKPQGYPGVRNVTYSATEVKVPPFLPDTPTCRAELAQYYESISRIDQGLGRLVAILKDREIYDNTIVIFTSDHGMAFPGGKTTLYEPGMRVPMIVHDPRVAKRGLRSNAMLSHVDLVPTILDMAESLGAGEHKPKDFHGRSWASLTDGRTADDRDTVYASHTFHEIQMYYPMKVVHGERYKLIWNIAHQLPYPFASDLWAAPTWQMQYKQGLQTMYGKRTVERYIHRPQFELFDLVEDPHETLNLSDSPEHQKLLSEMKAELKAFQKRTKDPWIMKWNYE